MTNKWLAAGLPLLIVAGAALVLWREAETPAPVAIDLPCPTPAAGCAARIGERSITVGLAEPRKTLQPFEVWVQAPGADQVQASFTMVDMNMGFNLYTLRPDKDGVFRAQVTLPACVSGRREWVMTVDIDKTTRLAVPFSTEL
ncbi:MAG: hypothetical protein Q8O33_17255 [Pseudomonadota bacterium]|nr:hypothetical protein [Pseudomonadota bacterium]